MGNIPLNIVQDMGPEKSPNKNLDSLWILKIAQIRSNGLCWVIGEDGPLLISLVQFKNLLRIQWVEYQDYTGPGFGQNTASFLFKTAGTFVG